MAEELIKKIIRSERKTIALEISPDGSLIVRAPNQVSLKTIDRFVDQKRVWILKKQRHAREAYTFARGNKFIAGEKFLYLGDLYALSVVGRAFAPVTFDGKQFLLWDIYQPVARMRFISWYQNRAFEVINKRAVEHSGRAGLKFTRIKIGDSKKCLGSCGAGGNLNFSWRLIMAPLNSLDYVIHHELAHLEVRNHSQKFWQRVALLMPDYRIGKDWLTANYRLLHF